MRGRAGWFPIGRSGLWVASLADIVKSKRAAGRPRDRAVLETLEKTLHEEKAEPQKRARRKRLALPPEKQMNFLRKRIGIGVSAL